MLRSVEDLASEPEVSGREMVIENTPSPSKQETACALERLPVQTEESLYQPLKWAILPYMERSGDMPESLSPARGGEVFRCFLNQSLSERHGEYCHATVLSMHASAFYAHRFVPDLHERIAP